MALYVMVLNDEETFTDLCGCTIRELPADAEQFDTESVERALSDNTLPIVHTFTDALPIIDAKETP